MFYKKLKTYNGSKNSQIVMKLENVLLVYKKSIYQIYFLEKKYQNSSTELFTEDDLNRLKEAHEIHRDTLDSVKRTLIAKGIRFREIYRARHIEYSPFDFVIAVGGDGTFLEASKRITSQSILGVNSDPSRSVGNFLACTAQDFDNCLDLVLSDKAKIQKFYRIQLKLNGKRLNFQVLNDILIAHHHPAAMSRYSLEINHCQESHRGSGIWISTAAGSSGAIVAAGGKNMAKGSRRIQYLPRELFKGGRMKYKLTGGIIDLTKPIIIQSQMREGIIYVDGPHLRIPFTYGSRLEIMNSPYPLKTITGAK